MSCAIRGSPAMPHTISNSMTKRVWPTGRQRARTRCIRSNVLIHGSFLASMAARQQDFDASRHHVGSCRRLFPRGA